MALLGTGAMLRTAMNRPGLGVVSTAFWFDADRATGRMCFCATILEILPPLTGSCCHHIRQGFVLLGDLCSLVPTAPSTKGGGGGLSGTLVLRAQSCVARSLITHSIPLQRTRRVSDHIHAWWITRFVKGYLLAVLEAASEDRREHAAGQHH